MGTNIEDFLREANRILKPRGILKIAEVRSRFEGVENENGLKGFFSVLKQTGFETNNKIKHINSMFFLLECAKRGGGFRSDKRSEYRPKACVYKKR